MELHRRGKIWLACAAAVIVGAYLLWCIEGTRPSDASTVALAGAIARHYNPCCKQRAKLSLAGYIVLGGQYIQFGFDDEEFDEDGFAE